MDSQLRRLMYGGKKGLRFEISEVRDPKEISTIDLMSCVLSTVDQNTMEG
jgi:hypothetical protein